MKNLIKNKYVLLVLGILILIITNPSERRHQEKVTSKFMQSVSKYNNSNNAYESAGQALGLYFVDIMVKNMIHRNNYLLFSLTEFSYQGKTKIIGFGILGYVYITNEIENLSQSN
jgi:hypothetical protein